MKALKIDFRFLADMAQDEYDIGVGECAIHPSDLKAVKDEGKLTREAKDSIDKVLGIVPQTVNTKIWTIQTLGPSSYISMVDLIDTGLYVADFKYSFVIPSTTAQFIEKIDAILKILLTMQRDVIRLANAILPEESKPTSHGNAFNRPSQSHHINPRLGFTRDTYYTPPKGAASRLPHHYYGPPPRSILPLLQALLEEDRAPRPIDNGNQVYDVYGYRALEDGTFYNKFTNKTTATHPMIPSKE